MRPCFAICCANDTHKSCRRLQADNNREDFFKFILSSKSFSLTADQLLMDANILMWCSIQPIAWAFANLPHSIAGSETTATALTALVNLLLTHSTVYETLKAEIRGAFSSANEIEGDSTSRLSYLSAVIEETLRIFPPAPSTLPRVSPGAIVDGNYIPAGVIVGVTTYALHRSSKYWQDPNKFRPERWLEGSEYEDDRNAFKPFSLGTRGCIGINLAYLEMKIAICRLLWEFDLEGFGTKKGWIEECSVLTLWRKKPVMMRVIPKGESQCHWNWPFSFNPPGSRFCCYEMEGMPARYNYQATILFGKLMPRSKRPHPRLTPLEQWLIPCFTWPKKWEYHAKDAKKLFLHNILHWHKETLWIFKKNSRAEDRTPNLLRAQRDCEAEIITIRPRDYHGLHYAYLQYWK